MSRLHLGVLALAITWLVFIIWTLYRLGASESEQGEITSRLGVRGFGVTIWVAMTGVGVYLGWQIDPSRPIWYCGAILAFVLLPVCLWGGYFWGKAMSFFFARRR